jgi:prepilin-type N-terminal cleavage/methylation domain-containing protein
MTVIMQKQDGFTLVELILAMAIFSLVMLAIVGGFIGIIHGYQSGLASRDTQQNSRFGMDTMVREIRQSDSVTLQTNVTDGTSIVCVAGTQSGQNMRFLVNNNRLVEEAASCSSSPSVGATAQYITSSNLRVANFQAEKITSDSIDPTYTALPTYRLTLRLTTNDVSQLDPTKSRCVGGLGSQFCSQAVLTTTVEPRGGAL